MNAKQPRLTPISGVSEAPSGPGVYSWHYIPLFSERDFREAQKGIEDLLAEGQTSEAASLCQNLLTASLLSAFKQEPYRIRASGQLKATYEGEIDHSEAATDAVIHAILERPELLGSLPILVAQSIPSFTPPIYIGKATSLRQRLRSHKRQIESLREDRATQLPFADGPEPESKFADRFVKRRLQPSGLYFSHLETDSVEEAVALENVLNRITYPLLGRN